MTSGINSLVFFSSFLKHLLIVTSDISLIFFTSFLLTFKLHICDIKYTTPAAIECGVFSGIKFSFSILIAIKWHNFVNSLLILRRLQYLSINASGFVLQNAVLSLLSISFSRSLMINWAFLHPCVALVTSR